MNMYPINRWVVISGSSIATSTCFTLSAIAQSAPPPGVTIPPNAPDAILSEGYANEQTIPNPSQTPRPLPDETPSPPPAPELQTPPIQESPEVTPPSGDRFFIKQVEVVGNTVLQDEIAKLIQPYENRSVTFEELLELRSAIIQLYIKNGYITSGAFLPNNQDLSSGTVKIQVVEGELDRIEIGGLNRLREGYVRSRLELATSTPLNQRR